MKVGYKMMNRIRKAACTLAAAVLVLSCWPGIAFGEAADAADGEGASVEAARPKAIISVDAPLRIAFHDEEPIDIKEGATNTGSVDVTFKNYSENDVRIVAADVVQNAAANIGNILDVSRINEGDELPWGIRLYSQATLFCDVKDTSETTGFKIEGTDGLYTISRATSGAASELTIPLTLFVNWSVLKDAASLDAAGRLKGNTTSLCSIVWTFEKLPGPSDDHGQGSTTADGGIFLKISDAPVSESLKPYANRIYNLEDIQSHSRALGSGASGTDSELYQFYYAIVTSMAPEGDYDCRVRYNGLDWPVRIIGLNQDVAAESFGEYSEGDLVGLTFQFRDLIAEAPFVAVSTSNGGGWGGENAKDIRNALNTGGTYYNNMTIKDSIVPVKKAYAPSYYNDTVNVSFTTDKMFLASYFELTGDKDVFRSCTWIPNEGTGKNHNEQYLFYKNKGIVGDMANFKWLVKNTTRDWETSKVTTTSGGNSSTTGMAWWERSGAPHSANNFLVASYTGAANSYNPTTTSASDISIGVCPCFSL